MDDFYFRKLDVYKNSKGFSKHIYSLLNFFPAEEKFGLCNQLRRAVTSIPINIAEGFGRFSAKEKSHFIEIAYGSTTEVLCELELSFELNYISEEQFINAENKLIVIAKQLSALRTSIINNGDSTKKTY